jgi:hypothetical protein
MSFGENGWNWGIIILSKMSQTERDKYYIFSNILDLDIKKQMT